MLESLADDPPPDDCAAFEAEDCGLAWLLPAAPVLDAVDAIELAGGGVAAGAGADADLGATGTGMEDKLSTESVAMGDRPA